MRPRVLVLLSTGVPLCLAAGVLAGCSGGDDEPKADPTKALASAKKQLDDTSGVSIALSTPKLPSGVDGLVKATGVGTHDPAFTGSIKVATSGITADADVVAVAGKVYAKLPFTTKFTRIDPSDYGAPDPAQLLSADDGLSSLLTTATKVKQGKQVRQGKQVLTSYSATVPGKAIKQVIPSARASAGFPAVFTLDDDERLAKAVLRGPFYPDASSVTYTIRFDDYGTKKKITAP